MRACAGFLILVLSFGARVLSTESFRPPPASNPLHSCAKGGARCLCCGGASSSSPSSITVPVSPVPWLIVGGGIHGVAIAARLLTSGAVRSASSILIVDPNPSLLHSWKTRAAATGMDYLRSSAGYHLDDAVDSLSRFGARPNSKRRRQKSCCSSAPTPWGPKGNFAKDYKRPSLDLFNSHCDAVISRHGLSRSLLAGTVTEVTPGDEVVRVSVIVGADGEEEEREYLAETVVLALGNGRPAYPVSSFRRAERSMASARRLRRGVRPLQRHRRRESREFSRVVYLCEARGW